MSLRPAPSLVGASGSLCFHDIKQWPYGPDWNGWVHTFYPQSHAVLGGTGLPAGATAASSVLDFQVARMETAWDTATYGPRQQVCADIGYENACNYGRVCWSASGALKVLQKKNPTLSNAASCNGLGETTLYDATGFSPLAFEHDYRLELKVQGSGHGTWQVRTSVDGVAGAWLDVGGAPFVGDPGFSGFGADRLTVRAKLSGSAPDGSTRSTVRMTAEGSVLGASTPIVCGYYDQTPAGLPAAPTGLRVSRLDACQLSVGLAWNAVAGANALQVYRDGLRLVPNYPDETATPFRGSGYTNLTEVYPNAKYRYSVAWFDANGAISDMSEPLDVTVPPACTRPMYGPSSGTGDPNGSLNLGVVMFRFAEASPSPFGADQVRKALFDPTNQPTSLRKWTEQASRGRASVSGDLLSGTEGEWVTMTDATGAPLRLADLTNPPPGTPAKCINNAGTYYCNGFSYDDYKAIALRGGVNMFDPAHKYEKFVFLVHGDYVAGNTLFGSDGIGAVRLTASLGNVNLGHIVHELGHAAYLDHAGWWQCNGQYRRPGPSLVDGNESNCAIYVYGWGADPMAVSPNLFDTMNLYRLGWLDDSEVNVDRLGGTYTVARFGTNPAVRQLRAMIDTNTFYVAEYRDNTGADPDAITNCPTCNPRIDTAQASGMTPGVYVWLYRNSTLTAHVPSPTGDLNNISSVSMDPTPLRLGEELRDRYRGVTLRYESSTSVGGTPGAVVRVIRDAAPTCPDLDQNGVLDCQETLVQNPSFHSTVTNWTAGSNSTATWSGRDGGSFPPSGSLDFTNANVIDMNGFTQTGATQCIPATESLIYDATVQYSLAAGQGSAWTTLGLMFFGSTNCSGSSLSVGWSPYGGASSTFSRLTLSRQAPAGARSVLVSLAVVKAFRDSAVHALFDDVLVKAHAATCPDLDQNGVPDCQETLLANPGFNVNGNGWSVSSSITAVWSNRDGNASTVSGSLDVNNPIVYDSPSSTAAGPTQCIPSVAGRTYRSWLRYFMPSGQGTGTAALNIFFFGATDCTGSLTGVSSTSTGATVDSWQTLQGTHIAPAATQSMLVRLTNTKPFRQAGLHVFYDNVLLK